RGAPVPGFEKETAPRRVSIAEYVEKTQRSCAVFNTPAVSGCHGWKLGEFLALGKAIVSTPLSRELPAPLIHGEHLHLVDGTRESMEEALHEISSQGEYRRHLEEGARRYYSTHLGPERVVAKIFEAAASK
ncbi:MAG: glycosyltransferase, partial [Acidobacteria bacterium]|nr:glycosyltransferase [Acidobacteriota bacterium]